MEEAQKIIDLVRQAYAFPEGKTRTAMLEQAVTAADQLQDLDLQFRVRIDFIEAAARSDDMPKMMTAVAWCQGVYDQEPDRFDVELMLGALATAINCAASIYQLTREQCEEMQLDYRRRLVAEGFDLRTYHQKRSYNALWMGDHRLAKEHFHRMVQMSWEDNAWDRLFRADYHQQMGDIDRALEEAKPILGANDDAEGAYHWAASFLLIPMAQRRQKWRAARCQRRAYEMLKDNPDHIELIGHHLLYFAHVRNWKAGAAMLERHMPWALDAFAHRELFEFYVGAWRFCRDAAEAKRDMQISLSKEFPQEEVGANGRLGDLASWMQQRAESLAEKFNQRNGNQHFTNIIAARIG